MPGKLLTAVGDVNCSLRCSDKSTAKAAFVLSEGDQVKDIETFFNILTCPNAKGNTV